MLFFSFLKYNFCISQVEQAQSILPSFGSSKHILFVAQDEVPGLEDRNKASLIKSLVAQRAKMEVVS